MYHSYSDQFWGELRALISGYPKFIYSGNNLSSLDGIPVFLYHTIDPNVFEAHLQFLNTNGYKTLKIEDFHEIITLKRKSFDQKSVLITIDDARSSVWRYAFPLLKKYNMYTTVFIIPGFTEETSSCRKNLDDVWEDKFSLKEIYENDPNDGSLCNWAEITQMHNSGLVNIESHTLFHREIFVNTKINDFIIDSTPFIGYDFPGTPYLTEEDIGKPILPEKFLGLPLFDSAPLMLAGPKLSITTEFISKCKEHYQNANLTYKNSEDWKSEIKNLLKDKSNEEKYFQVESNSRDEVIADLVKAREIIQQKLGTDAGNHLCLPWTRGNDETINIARELNIKSCFWGIIPTKKINKQGDDPYHISRLKNDFIPRLPGKERKGLFSIYKYKIWRRFRHERPY